MLALILLQRNKNGRMLLEIARVSKLSTFIIFVVILFPLLCSLLLLLYVCFSHASLST